MSTTLKDEIGFIIHSPDIYNHFSCVLELMPKGDFEIVAGGDETEAILEIAAGRNWPTTTLADCLNKGIGYKYLVSNHFVEQDGDNYLIQALGARNIRFMYGMGAANWHYAEWNKIYDMILCHGPYQMERLAFCQDTVLQPIGYPRYDKFFQGTIDGEGLKSLYRCEPAKPTVAWLPSWKELSSVPDFAVAVSELADRYNVLVKPHPLTVSQEPERMDFLRSLPFTAIIDDNTDSVTVYGLADYIIADYGGSMFGALYTDKNLLLLNVPGAEDLADTGDNSEDIVLREHITNLSSSEIDRLPALLADMGVWRQQAEVRKQLRRIFFSPYYGFSARITADILSNLDSIFRNS